MRILHIVTLVDDQHSYGGPLTVALGQCAELGRRCHQPLLLAGWQGAGEPPEQLDGVPAKLFRVRPVAPGLRYAGLVSIPMLQWIARHASEFDVAHVHLARDLVPLSLIVALRRAPVPYVVQTHGMIRPDARRSARILDRLAVQPALRKASHVLSLTNHEDADLRAVAGQALKPVRVRNGVALKANQVDDTSATRNPEVLFLARLHPRKGVLDFVRAAFSVLDDGIEATFTVAGPDDGDLDALRELLGSRPERGDRVRYVGAVPRDRAGALMARADIYVLPSVDEPYPMTVLEALASGTPVICTNSCGLADVVNGYEAGRVVSPGQPELAAAIVELLRDDERREALRRNAVKAAQEACSIASVGDQLESMYVQAGGGEPSLDSILWVTNIATPYRMPLWRELAEHQQLDVALLADSEPNRSWDLSFEGEPYAVHRLDAPVLWKSNDLTLYWPSLRLLRLISHRPSAMIVDGWESPAYLAAIAWAKLKRVPVIASYRGTKLSHRFNQGPVATLRRRIFTSANAVLTGGQASTEAVAAMGVPHERIAEGFNTVAVTRYMTKPSSVIDLAGQEGHRFLYVGQLIPRKNVSALIEAFATMAPVNTLTLVGEGPDEPTLRAQARQLDVTDRVVFRGHLNGGDLVHAYHESQTLVLPSLTEVWGLVANEALAAGLHVVISNTCGATPSLQGMPALYVADPNPADLARAMDQSRREWLGPVTNHPILQHTPEKLTGIILDLARRVTAEAGRPPG